MRKLGKKVRISILQIWQAKVERSLVSLSSITLLSPWLCNTKSVSVLITVSWFRISDNLNLIFPSLDFVECSDDVFWKSHRSNQKFTGVLQTYITSCTMSNSSRFWTEQIICSKLLVELDYIFFFQQNTPDNLKVFLPILINKALIGMSAIFFTNQNLFFRIWDEHMWPLQAARANHVEFIRTTNEISV